MKKGHSYIISSAILLLFSFFTIVSCKKNGPTVAVITVQDTLGKPVSGAAVTLWQDTSTSTQTGYKAIIHQTGTTDASGNASFEFQYEAYLNILATKNKDSATGIIQLKEHETVNQTVRF